MAHFSLAPDDVDYLSLHGIPLRRQLLMIRQLQDAQQVCLPLGLFPTGERGSGRCTSEHSMTAAAGGPAHDLGLIPGYPV